MPKNIATLESVSRVN